MDTFFSVHQSQVRTSQGLGMLTHPLQKIDADICHKFVRRWNKTVLMFFRVRPVCFPHWYIYIVVCLALSGWYWSKIQTKCETKLFLPAAVSATFSLVLLIVTLLPCCAQSTGYETLKYLRLFCFSLLQECTACVTHRQPEQRSMSSVSQDHHKIAFFEGKRSTDLL